ncbi:MAG: hypothetical protein JW782_07665 [Candidatus Saganbacteria bacterium]|nr:hypothetical protein [Candidatus Saganbacteria bacterium]
MTAIKLILSLLFPLLLGLSLLSAVLKERLADLGYLERLAAAFLTGSWLLVLIMFCLPLLGIDLSCASIGLTGSLLVIAMLPWTLKTLIGSLRTEMTALPRNWGFWLLLALITIKFSLLTISSIAQPVLAPDLLTYYALAAKHTFISGQPLHLFHEPPLPFLLQSWLPFVLGSWQDDLMAVFFPAFLACLTLIFYRGLARHYNRTGSLFFTFLLLLIPLLAYHGRTAYADLPMACFYSASTIYLFQFILSARKNETRSFTFLVLSLLLLGAAVWIKKSGAYYLLLNLVILGLAVFFERLKTVKLREYLMPLGLLLTMILPWLIFDRSVVLANTLQQTITGLNTFNQVPGNCFLGNIAFFIQASARSMFLEGNWGLLWQLFIISVLLYWERVVSRPRIYLFVLLLINLAALGIIFIFTGQRVFLQDNSLLNRLMLHFAPIVLFFCAELYLSENKT